MQGYTTDTWGYKILSDTTLSFYHVLLSQISLKELYDSLTNVQYITPRDDGSIFLRLEPLTDHQSVIVALQNFFEQKAKEHLDTPKAYYKIPSTTRQSLCTWSLAFEGCLAMLLLADGNTRPFLRGKWEYINSRSGGLYMAPYTILLYDEYPKVVHPITVQNYTIRKTIEQTIASSIRKIVKRIHEAHTGLEGLALLSLVEEKTSYSRTQITQIINEKSTGVKAPFYSQFFQATVNV